MPPMIIAECFGILENTIALKHSAANIKAMGNGKTCGNLFIKEHLIRSGCG